MCVFNFGLNIQILFETPASCHAPQMITEERAIPDICCCSPWVKINYLDVTEVNFGWGPFDWEYTTVLTPLRAPDDPGAELWHRQWQYCGTWSSPSPLCLKRAWTSSSWGTQENAAARHLSCPPRFSRPAERVWMALSPSTPPPLVPQTPSSTHRWLAHMFGLHTRWFLGYCGC